MSLKTVSELIIRPQFPCQDQEGKIRTIHGLYIDQTWCKYLKERAMKFEPICLVVQWSEVSGWKNSCMYFEIMYSVLAITLARKKATHTE